MFASGRGRAVRGSVHLKFPGCVSPLCVSPWRWNVPGGRHPSSDPQSGRASLHPPAGLRRLSGFSDLCFMSGAEGRSSSSQLLERLRRLQPSSRAGLDGGLINLCVLSWPTCPSPGGTAAPAAKRSSQDTTHTASAPAGCSARPTRSCECATVGWCTCPVRSRTRVQRSRCYRGWESLTHSNRDSFSLLSVGLAPFKQPTGPIIWPTWCNFRPPHVWPWLLTFVPWKSPAVMVPLGPASPQIKGLFSLISACLHIFPFWDSLCFGLNRVFVC